MPEQFITCPSCGNKIPLTAALTQQIEDKLREQFNAEIARRGADHLAALNAKEAEYEARLTQERADIETKAQEKAKTLVSTRLTDLETQLQESAKAAKEATERELALLKSQREMRRRVEEAELEIARRVDEGREGIRKAVLEKVDEENKLKLRERDLKIEAMVAQIDDLKKKAVQGSQQLQGEALEVEVEDLLRLKFSSDNVEPIGKGVKGGDVVQYVCSGAGQVCGSILWECKRAKNWNDKWLSKLREDQRQKKADIAILVSDALPPGINNFALIDGVWVAGFSLVESVALAMRASLIALAQARAVSAGKGEKAEMVYDYLSGSEFVQRISAIVESFIEMKADLESERNSMERQWAKREKQLRRAVSHMAGLYGDLQGIIGPSLPTVKVLELPAGGTA